MRISSRSFSKQFGTVKSKTKSSKTKSKSPTKSKSRKIKSI